MRFVSIDVLKDLGSGKFLIDIEGKQQQALSKKPLQENATYFAKYLTNKDPNKPALLSKLIKLPNMIHNKTFFKEYTFDTKEILHALKNPKELQQQLLEKLANAPTKEHFSQLSPLLLSLHHQVFTFPFVFYEHLGIFQLKKRYNKKSKKTTLEFYALLENLGAISGVVFENKVELHVVYEEIKDFLEQHEKELPITLYVSIVESIEPLFDTTPTNQLLDIKT